MRKARSQPIRRHAPPPPATLALCSTSDANANACHRRQRFEHAFDTRQCCKKKKEKGRKTQIPSNSNQLKGLIISAFQAVNQLSGSNELSICAPAISDLCFDCLLAPISSLHSISTKVIALCVYHMFSLINVLMTAVRTTLK